MAYIKKARARKELVRDNSMISVSNFAADGGLRFNIEIGDYKISLTHMEKDYLIKKWDEQQKEHES